MKKLLLVLILTIPTLADAAWVVTKSTKVDVNNAPQLTLTYTKNGVIRRIETISFDASLSAKAVAQHAYDATASIDAFDALQVSLPDGVVTPVAPDPVVPITSPEMKTFITDVRDWKDKELLLAQGVGSIKQGDVDAAFAVVKTTLGAHPEFATTYAQVVKQYN